ncbi:MAG TPA: hypothetical protein VFT45_04350 [Longimicrobium sp.]|nr:hypothetical protein [Longimicrobium sp.]
MQTTLPLPAIQPDRTAPAPPKPRRLSGAGRALRETLLVAALVAAATLPFLASPHPGRRAAAYCLNPVNLGGRLHVDLNCDSHVFLVLAEDPRRVLTPGSGAWQSRPLYAALGWALAMPYRAAGLEAVGARLPSRAYAPGRGGAPPGRLLPWYAGFITLNALLLAASLMLFRRMVGARSYRDPAIVLPVAVLLANEVTRAFFWTPHLQLFNVFVPVLSLWLFCRLQPRLGTLGMARAAGMGAALGVCALAYGAFAVPAAGAALLLLAGGPPLGRRVARAAALLAAFALPLLAWTAYVVWRTGSFHAPEVARYRQFVWMADAAARGPGAFAGELAANLGEYVGMVGRAAAFPALMVASLALAMHVRGGIRAAGEHERRVGVAVAVYLLASLPFFGLMGFYATRLAWTVVPALLAVMALETAALRDRMGTRRWMATAAAVVLALAHTAFWVMRTGPFS